MKTYQEFVTDITTNDAAIEVVAVALTLNRWGKTAVSSTIGAGESTRAWWESGASTETGHHGSWVVWS